MTESVELSDRLAERLGCIDEQRSFWIDFAFALNVPSISDAAWDSAEWHDIRLSAQAWLRELDPDGPPATHMWRTPLGQLLVLRARGRVRSMRGVPESSFLPENAREPDFYLAGGVPRIFDDLTRTEVDELARGDKQIEVDLPSYRSGFAMLADAMDASGVANTSRLDEGTRKALRLRIFRVDHPHDA